MTQDRRLGGKIWAVAMLLGACGAQGAAGLLIEVESRHAAGGREVIRHELDRELADRLGGALPTVLEVREEGASPEAAAWPAELLFPEEPADGRATLLLEWPGAQAAGEVRRLMLRAAPDAVRAPSDLRFEQADGLLRVGNGHFEVTHDLQKGGAIVAVTYPDGTRLDVRQRDGVRGYSLAQDKEPKVTVLGRVGGLGATVEIEARFLDRNAQHEALTVRYQYQYTADSPWIRLEAELPEQTPGQVHTQVRLLDLEFATQEALPESVPLITAGSGAAYGGLIPQRENVGGDHRPRAGTFWHGPAWALAWAQPALNQDFVHEWSGERQILSALLYLGPAETATENLLRAEGPVVRAILPSLAERLAAGQGGAAELAGAQGALAQALLTAARQRMEDSCDLAGLRELLIAGETVLAAPPAADGVAHYETEHFLALANEQTALIFGRQGTSVWLDGVFRAGRGFIRPTGAPRTLWHAWLLETASGDRVWTSSRRATETTIAWTVLPDGGRRLEARSKAPAGPGVVAVNLAIELAPGEALAHWSFDLQPADDSLGLWEAAFPVISGVRADGPAVAVDYLTTTGYIGRSPNPVLGGFHEGYGRHSVYRRGQYRAYYQDGIGLYLGAHDPGLAPVGTLVRNSGWAGGLEFSYLHPTEYMGQPGAGLTLEGKVVFGTFAGDWYDAAQLYRAWLQQQDWFPADPLHARADVPEWAKQAVISVRSAGEGAARLHAELGYPPSVNWYYHAWSARDAEIEETHPTAKFQSAPNFPTPAGFERRLEAPRREGIKTGVYTINNWWDYTARSWIEDGAREAVVHMLGYDSPMFHNPRGMGIICQATETWVRKQGEVGAQTAAIGADGTYLDLGGGARMPFLCFARNHGHPPGGGAFMTTSKRAALRQLRESARTVNPEFILITEGSEGYFLTVKDGWINFANSTPVSSVLYYDYLRPLGNKRVVTGVGPVTRNPTGALTPAKHFAWGSSLGRFGYNHEWEDLRWAGGVAIRTTNPQALAYYRNLVWHKYVARPWLNLGRMLRPLELTDVTPPPAPEFFEDTFVPAAVWQAPDHSVALVFANGWHSQEIAFRYRFDPAVYGLPSDGSLALYRLTPAGQPPDVQPQYERVAELNGPLERQEQLGPGAVLILVARPTADAARPMPPLQQHPAPAVPRPTRSAAPAPPAPAPVPPVIPPPQPRPDAPLPTLNQIEENQELL